ncbi:hypothetical protein ACF064_30750 [Streptomyces sp. NPDC015492]|uniref:hypothetical protein n=1 Tax=Streptomyces sp. NPDC015492 TaxID=3364958 RepID=UPI0036FED643
MTPPEPLPPLLPTRHRSPGERLLHGKGIAAAADGVRAEDWTGLDQSAHVATWWTGSARSSGRVRVGFHWFDSRELDAHGAPPHWHEAGPDGRPAGVAWSRPPTESEIALALCHDDPRLRAAALRLSADGTLPAAALPLVLLRCADTDGTVRGLARPVLGGMLDTAGDATVRALAPLALLLDLRRHGGWAREAVLARTGGIPAEAVAELLASRRPECRTAGVRAAESAGLLDAAGAYALAESEADVSVAGHAARAAARLTRRALDAPGGPTRAAALAPFHAFMAARRDPDLGRAALTAAHASGLLRAEDLARLAVGHPEPRARRHALGTLLAEHDPTPFLGALADARDAAVRRAAVARLRSVGRAGELTRHLTDANASVRAVARRELEAGGGDAHPVYRALCADPAAVTPAAVTGLAERPGPGDPALLHALTRHPRGPVRARAVGALRMLGALPGGAPVAFADDPDRAVRHTALRAVRRLPDALRACLATAHGDVRAAALGLLASRHGLDWREAVPFLEDPDSRVTRVARRVVGWNASELPLPFLLGLAAPGRPLAQRAVGLALIGHHDDAGALLAALRLADDTDPALRGEARLRAVHALRRLDEEVGGPHGEEIRRLVERHAAALPLWYEEIRRRNRAARRR